MTEDTNSVTRKGGKNVEPREVMEIKAAIEILKDIKEAADKGLLWRDPNNYSEQYRRSYEAVISEYFGFAISALEGLAQEDKRHQAPDPQRKPV